MNTIRSAAIAIASATILLSAPAHALRCKHKVIAVGDRSVKLLHYCGKPLAVHTRHAAVGLVGTFGHALWPVFSEDRLIEEWTYNFGPHRLMRVVWIENGVVERIEVAGYGFEPDD